VEFLGDGFEQGARLFLLHVEVAVAGDAEGGAVEDAVAPEHRIDVCFDELFEEQKVALAFAFWQGNEGGKGARDGDDAKDFGAGAGLEFAFVAQQEREAEGLVEDARKGVRGVQGYGSEEGVDLLLEEFDGELAVGFAELLPAEERDAGAFEFGDEAIVPAGGLSVVELVEAVADALHALMLGESASVEVMREVEAFFEALQDTGDADLDELVEVAGGDGEKLDAFEEGVGGVVGFFEDAAVELKPALVAIDEAATGRCCGNFRGAAGWGLARCGLFPDGHASYETKSGLRGRRLISRTTLIL